MKDPNGAFGVDLLLPQVGGSARKTNYDYTGSNQISRFSFFFWPNHSFPEGTLPELIDIIIQEKASLFVSAVGVPPRWAVDKLHAAGIPVMNMIGSPKHVPKCIAAGVGLIFFFFLSFCFFFPLFYGPFSYLPSLLDIICAQGGEGGGHTGEIASSILWPMTVDLCKFVSLILPSYSIFLSLLTFFFFFNLSGERRVL